MLIRKTDTFFLTDLIIYVYMNTFLFHVSQYVSNLKDGTVLTVLDIQRKSL